MAPGRKTRCRHCFSVFAALACIDFGLTQNSHLFLPMPKVITIFFNNKIVEKCVICLTICKKYCKITLIAKDF